MKSLVRILPIVALFSATAFGQSSEKPQTSQPALPAGALNEQSLGDMLNAIGLKPLKTDKRYDFAFKTSVRGEEWKFSMSSVLSRNGKTIWLMAWLDEIPKTSAEVPQTALLRLLAANDRMGNGKFFAYIPTNRRFVLQRVVRNEGMSTKKLMEGLQDLALSVADEYPNWAVANWSPKIKPPTRVAANGGAPLQGAPTTTQSHQQPTATSGSASKYTDRRIQ